MASDKSLYARLRKLFSTGVVVRRVGPHRIKVADTDNIQTALSSAMRDRYARVYSGSGYGGSSPSSNYAMNMAYMSQRIMLFRDYDIMDMDSIVNAALNIYADEATVKNEQGRVLRIDCDDGNVKQILENLYYDVLNVEFNLYWYVRSLVKYGDFFLFLEIAPGYGVINSMPLSAYDTTRLEGIDPTNPHYVCFETMGGASGGQKQRLENFEVAHFRLLGDANFLPYGKSILEGGRRVFRQLLLMEDAMLIHRIMRAPEKRLFKIDVGTIPPNEIDAFMERLMQKTKKVPFQDPSTGEYNLRYNMQNILEDFYIPVRGGSSGTDITNLSGLEYNAIDDIQYLLDRFLASLMMPKAFLGFEESLAGKLTLACVVPETKVPLLNGKMKTVQELIDDYNAGVQNWVYSIDESTQNVVPGQIEWAGYTRKNANLVRVTLDNGEYIDCTPDHKFMMRTGEWRESKDLVKGDSLMPLYKKPFVMRQGLEYEKIYHPSSNLWQWTHKMVDDSINGKLEQPTNERFDKSELMVIHHKDFDRFNNSPSNLLRMKFLDHTKLHSQNTSIMLTEESKQKAIATKRLMKYHPSIIREVLNSNNWDTTEFLNHHIGLRRGRPKRLPVVVNHKVERVEFLSTNRDTCDIRIKTHHNFATAAGVIIHNSEDVRFARTIERIQRIVASELYKIGVVHLYAQGYTDESLINFTISLTTPSTIYEQEKINLWKEKVMLARDAIDGKMLSKEWVYENIFKMSKDEMDKEKQNISDDQKEAFRFEQLQQGQPDPLKFGFPQDQQSPQGGEAAGAEQSTVGMPTPAQSEPMGEVGRPEKGSVPGQDSSPMGRDPLGGDEIYHTIGDKQKRKAHSKFPLSLEGKAVLKRMGERDIIKSQPKALVEGKKIVKDSDKNTYLDENILENDDN